MKALKWIVGIIVVLVAAGFIFMNVAKNMTRKHSPNQVVEYTKGDLTLTVDYCRPYKKGRQIFDSLVPYGVTWRTGANDATTFQTSKDIKVAGMELKAGKYTLWTVPNATEWEVVWNSKMYDWGVDFNAMAQREPEHDALKVQVRPEVTEESIEQFTIRFKDEQGLVMVLEWDNTRVSVPIEG